MLDSEASDMLARVERVARGSVLKSNPRNPHVLLQDLSPVQCLSTQDSCLGLTLILSTSQAANTSTN